MNILVTGGAGFIGSHFLRYQLSHYPTDRVVNLDCLTYAGNLANVADLASTPRYHFIQGDIRDAATVSEVLATHQIDVVVNFAAESHVDRSIEDPAPFVSTNVVGVQVLLDACRRAQVRLVQVSTTGQLWQGGWMKKRPSSRVPRTRRRRRPPTCWQWRPTTPLVRTS